MSKTSVVPAVLLPLLLAAPGMVRAQDSCHVTRDAVLIEGHQSLDVVSVASVGDQISRRLGYRFAVTASDGRVDLGSWSKVSGLEVTIDVIDYRAGGGTITLHRAAGTETLLVRAWLEELAHTYERPTLGIALLDASGEPIATWTFTEVYPIKWTISGFDADESGVAIETLVIAYESVIVARRRS